MRAYKEISEVKSEGKGAESPVVVKRKLHIFSSIFIMLISFSCLGISLSSTSLAREVRQITSYWSPNIADLGKLKFVSGDEAREDVMSQVAEFAMPFETSLVTEVDAGVFEVNGLGGMLVHACLKGRVEKIENNGEYKTITLSHGNNLKTTYSYIDTLGVKEGDGVEKNTPLGVSLSSKIMFKVLYKNKVLAGLTVNNGEFSFM